ncbi:hypothetical protein TrRE_jg4881 [Triparma retinervis]|uniref:CHCH domain-containing protein n=1 Tax=Triparma retinervis TaxID=2557542 RepID=A0A9W7FWR9_9STRA|nr:hypothetical protein TrRE_jg4881 [Triparma retinervis]
MGFGRSRSSAPARRPPQSSSAPARQSSSGPGMLGQAAGMIGQGMTFGIGSAIGHRVVGGIADSMTGGSAQEEGPAQHQQQQREYTTAATAQGGECTMEKGNYFECLKSTGGDSQACGPLMEMMKNCQAGGLQGNGEKQWN